MKEQFFHFSSVDVFVTDTSKNDLVTDSRKLMPYLRRYAVLSDLIQPVWPTFPKLCRYLLVGGFTQKISIS